MFRVLTAVVFLTSTTLVSATCPLCVLGAGATFWIANRLGISDLSCGIFISSILTASAQWLGKYSSKEKPNFIYFLISYIVHFSVIFYIYIKYVLLELTIFGLNIFIFGAIVGFISSILSFQLYKFLKNRNNNKAYFNYQKVLMFIIFMLISIFICSKLNSLYTVPNIKFL